MAEFDDVFKPGQSIDEVGGSLLQRAQDVGAMRRRQRRGPSTSDMLKGLGTQLIGHFVGDYFRGRMDDSLQKHLNDERTLQQRALVKESINDANIVLEKNRAALAHSGGLKGYLIEERTASNLAYLKSKYADRPNTSETAMKTLAAQQAADGIEDYMKAFQERVSQARKLESATGGDPLAYYTAIKEAAGADQGLAVRGIKTMLSKFRDPDDNNVDGALYRSATTQRIYNASEEYRNAFDKLYVQTASAEAASNITEALEKTGDLPLTAKSMKPVSITRTNRFGEQVTESYMQVTGYDNNPESYIDFNGNRISVSAFLGRKADSKQDGVRMSQKRALAVFADAVNALDAGTLAELRTSVNNKLTEKSTSEQRNKVSAVFGEQIYLTDQALQSQFGSKLTSNQRMSIAVRAQILDRDAFDEQPTLLANTSRADPFVFFKATVDHFGGDIEDVPASIQAQFKNQFEYYFSPDSLQEVSAQELRNAKEFVDRAGFGFKGVRIGQGIFDDDSFKIGGDRAGRTISDFLDYALSTKTRG
jgi:hypothetical protein